jgi:hypothetical protein
MKWTKLVLLIAVGVAGYMVWNKMVGDKIGFGTIDDGIYRNKYFGMRVVLPDDWHPLDEEGKKKLMEMGRKMIAGQDKMLGAALDANEMNTVDLLMVYKHPPGAPVPFNPSLSCVAEKVSHLPGIKTGRDYLYHVRTGMQATRVPYSMGGDIHSENVGGVNFYVQDMSVPAGTWLIQQKFYAAIMKEYVLCFVITYTNQWEYEALRGILATVNFS